MKQFMKGLSIQLLINLALNLIRIMVAHLIIKFAPDPTMVTSFAKDSGRQIIAFLAIIIYNLIVAMVVFIMIFRKKDTKFFIGFGIPSIIFIIKDVIIWTKKRMKLFYLKTKE